MYEIYNSLVEEGLKLKEEHRNKNYLYKIFMRSVIQILCIAFIWIIFNLVFTVTNLKNSFVTIFSCVLYMFFVLRMLWICSKQYKKKKIQRNFLGYIISAGLFMAMKNDFSMVKEVALKAVITLIVYFIMITICTYLENHYFSSIILLSICTFIILGIISDMSTAILIEWFIFVIFFLLLNLKEKNKRKLKNEMKEELYPYEYLHFINVCILIVLICL